MNLHDINNWFTYHQPSNADSRAYEAIREAAKRFALVLVDNTIPGDDQRNAIYHLRQSVFVANASIACGGGDPSRPGS